MEVMNQHNYEHVFPMEVVCKRIVDQYGFDYGSDTDFCGSVLKIEANDIQKHGWFKYPDYSGVDYGVFCPICHNFIPIHENLLPKQVKLLAKECFVV